MGAKISGADRIQVKVAQLFEGMAEDLKLVGEAGASAIVQTTLAGIGENDAQFAPYSPSYQKQIDAVGGKARDVVDLRGIFLHEGQTNPRYRSEKRRQQQRAGRQAYVGVTRGGKTFQAKTPVTRPSLGLTDPRSEMSLDLIKVESTDTSLTLTYSPRAKEHMIFHQEGDGKLPQRKWFTVLRQSVQAAMGSVLKTCIEARVAKFNE